MCPMGAPLVAKLVLQHASLRQVYQQAKRLPYVNLMGRVFKLPSEAPSVRLSPQPEEARARRASATSRGESEESEESEESGSGEGSGGMAAAGPVEGPVESSLLVSFDEEGGGEQEGAAGAQWWQSSMSSAYGSDRETILWSMIQEEQEEGEGDGEGEGEEAGEEERENEKKVIRQSLVDFYSRRDPAKVAQVDTVMERYRGREHEILSVIAKAEKETPPQPQQQQHAWGDAWGDGGGDAVSRE